jgi:hypothetical protein
VAVVTWIRISESQPELRAGTEKPGDIYGKVKRLLALTAAELIRLLPHYFESFRKMEESYFL